MSVTAILRMRRDDASNWSTANPVIESGQLGFEKDTGLFKLGNGVSSWNALPYVTPFAASAGTQSAGVGTLNFSDSNGISFGVSSGTNFQHTITASFSGGGGGPTISVSGTTNTGSQSTGTVVFDTSPTLRFGYSAGTITGSVLGGPAGVIATTVYPLASASSAGTVTRYAPEDHRHPGVTISAATGSASLGALTFNNNAGLAFGIAGNVITGSYTVPTVTNSTLTLSDNATSIGIARLAFTQSNGITMSLSTTTGGSATLVASYTVPAIPTPEIRIEAGTVTDNFSAVSFGNSPTLTWTANTGGGGDISISATPYIVVNAGGATGTVSQLSFADSQGVSFGLNAGTITATVATNYLTSQSNQALSGSNGSFTFQTATFGSSNGLHFYTTNGSLVGSYTVPTQSVQPVAASGSNGSFAFSTVTFGNLNGLSFYSSNGSMVASHNGLTTQSAQAASASNGSFTFETLNFSNANNVTFGTSAGGIVTASVNAAGGGYTVSGSNPHRYAVLAFANIWNASYLLQPLDIPCDLAFNRVVQPVNFSHATNSTGTMTITGLFALYTLNGSTLSSAYSQSASQTLLASGTASSSNWVGPRLMSFPWTTTVSPGTYVLGVGYRTTSGGANMSISIGNVSRVNSSMSGMLGVGSANSAQWENGFGMFSASTSNVPGTVGLSEITGISSAYLRQPALFFASNGIY